MRVDPQNWALSFTGCVYDWILTRKWKKIFRGFIPLFVLLIVFGLVTWGHWLSREKLADHYLKLANAEVADWQSQWSPVEGATTPEAEDKAATKDGAARKDGKEKSKGDEDKEAAAGNAKAKSETLSPFAETLFRRVQQLRSGDQISVYYVAMSLAQRGMTQQARSLLRRIAPNDRQGFLPAHAWLAEQYLSEQLTPETMRIAKHHSKLAMNWSRTPAPLLARIADLFAQTGDRDSAVQALKVAADRDSRYALPLSKLSQASGNKLLAEQSFKRAESAFEARLKENPADLDSRLLLAEALVNQGRVDEAEKIIREGLDIEDKPLLRRALSEVYRFRFLQTAQVTDNNWTGNIQLLDQAFRIDPTNPMIAEEVAKLARIGGDDPTETLLEQLRTFLAEGKATPTTHAWIAELYLIRENYEKAIPHLEQVVTRLPNATNYLNNLAWVLADIRPDRLDEALRYVDEAIRLEPRNGAFHDTRGIVLTRLGRDKESVTAFETAIELEPQRDDFHTNVAAAYRKLGDETQAGLHEGIAQRLREKKPTSTPADRPANQNKVLDAIESAKAANDSKSSNANDSRESSEGKAPEANSPPASNPKQDNAESKPEVETSK